jgi:histidinol phosphatase-like enzyme (inositol monophosphatase family)
MHDTNITDRLELARRIAQEAGELTLRYFRQGNFAVEWKHDASPVTVADREAEQLMRRHIHAAFPGDGILGEEFGEQPGSSGYRWILDPIDGTQSFIHGVPLYGNLIGLEYELRSVLGVINIPAMQECVWAAEGHGAHHMLNGKERPARVSACPRLADGLFLTSEFAGFYKTGREHALTELTRAARRARTWGDCYGYLLVATGRAEAMIDPIMNVWDTAALQPILQEAGGTFTDWQGRPTIHGGEAVATNGHVREEVLAVTRRFLPGELTAG